MILHRYDMIRTFFPFLLVSLIPRYLPKVGISYLTGMRLHSNLPWYLGLVKVVLPYFIPSKVPRMYLNGTKVPRYLLKVPKAKVPLQEVLGGVLETTLCALT